MNFEKPYSESGKIEWTQAPDSNYCGPVTTRVVSDITDRVSEFIRNGD